jgi:hypothetical protein
VSCRPILSCGDAVVDVRRRQCGSSVKEYQRIEDEYVLRFEVGLDHLEAEGGYQTLELETSTNHWLEVMKL